MSNYRIAVRYAKSLLELAIDKKQLENVKGDIAMINRLCKEDRSFLIFLKNPIIHSYRKQSILKQIFEKKINKITYAFIEIVTRKSRENVLPEIADQFLVQYRNYKKVEIVEVITPIDLDQKLEQEFTNIAENYIPDGWTIELNKKVDKEIIGGFVLKVGDKQIDSSVSTKLREIRKKLIVS
jgi:F-type H+-transporting ATPase subunit delta